MVTRIREKIDFVGFVDWTMRDFHGFDAEYGTTYNAYLIRDEKPALIDTVKEPYADILLGQIAELIDPSEIHYVICNHAEPDHSGCLPDVMRAAPRATLICDSKCASALRDHYDTAGWNIREVSTGDTLSLGRRTLQFIETPMVHWPESMFTYVPEEKLLFSMDVFGQHFASSTRFNDEVDTGTVMSVAKVYYANIIMPYGRQMQNALKSIEKLDIDLIAPSHGLMWRNDIPAIIGKYRNWAAHRPEPKIVVIFDSMWGSTDAMARAILQGASIPGVRAELIHVRKTSLSRIATAVLDAAAVAFGSSTLNGGMMPMAGAALTYLKGLRPAGKAALAFGSYGWSRNGPDDVHEWFGRMKWEILDDPLVCRYRPTDEVLVECRAAGRKLADHVLQMTGGEVNA